MARPHEPERRLTGLVERRQVTALAYDLVGSTPLAERLDPEELREILQAFHQVCTAAVEEYGGRVNLYAGDGGMAFFGYPITYENGAERAIRAGLAITARCGELSPTIKGAGVKLHVRVGIATGRVVAGELSGDGHGRREVVGIAPHLASRLQAAAAPNTVLVAESTRSLVGTLFRFGPGRALALAGFSQPQQAFAALRERRQKSRFEGARSGTDTPLLSRDAEVSLILDRWDSARHGRGQAVVVTGEAGLGKSRLAASVRASLADEATYAWVFQCSPLHMATPLYPVAALLERVLLMRPDKYPSIPEARLNRLLAEAVPPYPEAAPYFANLLPHVPSSHEAPPPSTPEQLKEDTFSALLEFTARLSARGPMLIIVEDAQWIDPTSLELLRRLMDRLAELPVLMIVTTRSGPFLRDVDPEAITRIELAPLSEAAAAMLVGHMAGPVDLPREQVRHIVDRAEGNPFFLEELTRTVLASATADSPDQRSEWAVEIPRTLSDMLTARLDQSGRGKQVAQIASAIGRSFSLILLQKAADLDAATLGKEVRRLITQGLLTFDAHLPQPVFAFRHALLQVCAYDSMLKARRQAVHQRIAEVLEADFQDSSEAASEILARHLAEAGLPREAIAKLRIAGQNAALRPANVEAVHLLQRALALCAELAPGPQRDETELDIRLALGPLLITTAGPGAPEVQDNYQGAVSLCEGMSPDSRHFTAHWGWWRTAPDFTIMRQRADRLSHVALSISDPHLKLQAHHCQWATLFMLGEQKHCCEHIREGLDLYDAAEHGTDAILYGGHDPKVCALGEKALSLWIQGFPSRAAAVIKSCARHAAQLDHLASRSHFEEAEINLLHYFGDVERVADRARRMNRLARGLGFRDVEAKAEIFGGWAMAFAGNPAGGSDLIEHGLATQRMIGTQEDFPAYLEMLADVHGLAGEHARGLDVIDEAVAIAEETGLQYWSAELHRRRGELLLALGRTADALAAFDKALAVASAQSAHSLFLRAATSKTALLAQSGERSAGSTLLKGAIGSLPEAAATQDRNRATRVLDRLR
ncbi:ATP-binding protein [Microvirga aerophila]|uniref:Adenylate/guanylate cyclase domain-containing protein n=1 Tax=Microvirga aerophila TaxID=670291 RepID=A0A512BST6_9HYPH|nr:AAA family ATPase [Microvirga aerophila]GEO15053.1 adenylate/guanylate cyclase domain-containing protein [Microvirga aerophila]